MLILLFSLLTLCIIAAVFCLKLVHKLYDIVDDYEKKFSMLSESQTANEKTIDELSKSVSKSNDDLTFVSLLVDHLVEMHTPKRNKRYEKLDENHKNFKELREVFNHDVKECAHAMKISMKTARRYENWRIENTNQ